MDSVHPLCAHCPGSLHPLSVPQSPISTTCWVLVMARVHGQVYVFGSGRGWRGRHPWVSPGRQWVVSDQDCQRLSRNFPCQGRALLAKAGCGFAPFLGNIEMQSWSHQWAPVDGRGGGSLVARKIGVLLADRVLIFIVILTGPVRAEREHEGPCRCLPMLCEMRADKALIWVDRLAARRAVIWKDEEADGSKTCLGLV
jgi:hypothetical protein